MGTGLELDAGGHSVEQLEQLPELRFVERLADLAVEPLRVPFGLPEKLLSSWGQVEVADAAVARVRPSLEQIAPL